MTDVWSPPEVDPVALFETSSATFGSRFLGAWSGCPPFSWGNGSASPQFPSAKRLAGFEVGPDRPHLRAWLDRVAARPSAPSPHVDRPG